MEDRQYVDREFRTFETRVQFISDIFSNKYKRHQIMASCINYKLDKSYETYLDDIHKDLWMLEGRDPIAILKRIDN